MLLHYADINYDWADKALLTNFTALSGLFLDYINKAQKYKETFGELWEKHTTSKIRAKLDQN